LLGARMHREQRHQQTGQQQTQASRRYIHTVSSIMKIQKLNRIANCTSLG
jgi:hypothetical protein